MSQSLRISLVFLMFAPSVGGIAAPVVSNVRAAQRTDTHLVDIYYNLATPDAPSTVSLEISADGGQNYNISATTVTGEIGKNILSGSDHHVVWNAGKDRPGVLTTTMRFKIVADDGIPNDQQLDPDTLDFITRATSNGDPVAPTARQSIDNFVRESKRLGFWQTMVFVPCRQGYGSMNTLGGSPKRTNNKFIRQGTTNLTTDGVSFIPGNGYANRVQTPFNYNPADEPLFIGVLGHTNTGGDINPGYSFLRWDTEPTRNLLGTYNCGGGEFTVMMGFSTRSSIGGEYLLCNDQCTSIRRPNFAGAQFDGSHTLKCVHNQKAASLTAEVANTGRPDPGPVYFFQPASESETHVIQGCVLFYGDVGNLPLKEFWPVMAGTLLSDRSSKYTYLCMGGQSNAWSSITSRLLTHEWKETAAPLFHFSNYRYGGAPISYWVGEDPQAPQRSEPYNAAKLTWLDQKPALRSDLWNPIYLWIQGESDTETDERAGNYAQQLQNLVSFLRQDLRQDLIMAVAQIDYSIKWRTDPAVGNFTLTNCTGTAQDANSLYHISPVQGLANSYAAYEWSSGDFVITKDGGTGQNRWRIHKAGTIYYTAVQDEDHPELVATWTAENGATGTPTFGTSRTGRIERVRKTERSFVKDTPRSFVIDSRGCERLMDTPGGSDYVHMTEAGYSEFGSRFATAHQNWQQ